MKLSSSAVASAVFLPSNMPTTWLMGLRARSNQFEPEDSAILRWLNVAVWQLLVNS